MITVKESTWTHETDRMKLIGVKMSLESNIRRCEALLSFVSDPIARQSIELIVEGLKKDIEILEDLERS